jgi:two-component system LytT family response regulator
MAKEKQIKALIVEDEARSIAFLKKLIETYCPEVEVIGEATTVNQAVDKITQLNPQLVFLDIALPDGDGFEVLERIPNKTFQVIFITAYDKYAVRAFEFSALHYLLKPVSSDDLQKAVDRFWDSNEQVELDKKLTVLNSNLNEKIKKLILPTSDGLSIIKLNELIRCEASRNYTICYLLNKKEQIVSKPLGIFEDILSDFHFVRVHNTHLINLKYVSKYIKGKGGIIIMKDQSEIHVSKTRKNEFLEKLKSYANYL